ncbi:MAG: hypothetical protein JXC85_00625 [Candidatus Aenigmarchaeota archaeon]|nr:hypothetical protein [Candidatus Aenigmarchaeota archaeon]
MVRRTIFFASVIAVISLLINLMLASSNYNQASRISSLEAALGGLRDDDAGLGDKPKIACTDPVLKGASGMEYARLSASAGRDGKVTLELENLHDDSIFAINIREVQVVYDRGLERIAADSRSAPTFKGIGLNSTCSGIIDPGESLSCESPSFSDIIAGTLEQGGDTFIINHLSVELDLKPYYFVASDICVGIS